MVLHFQVKPRTNLRPRFSTRGGFVSTYDPPENKVYKMMLRGEVPSDLVPLDCPISVQLILGIPRPKSKKNPLKHPFPSVKPDVDNLAKIVLDALNGLAWVDDALIVDLRVVKVYIPTDETGFVHLKAVEACQTKLLRWMRTILPTGILRLLTPSPK